MSYFYTPKYTYLYMTNFIGEYICKVDAKGRVTYPSAFKKQITGDVHDRFVIKKDLDYKCLVLVTLDEWERQSQDLMKRTNRFDKDHKQVIREFFKGAAEVQLDANNRILIPRRLLEEINNATELVLAGQFNQIEIWDKADFDTIGSDQDKSKELFQNVLGGASKDEK